MNFLAGIICEFLAKIIMFVCRKRLLPFDKIIIKSLSLLTHCKLEQFDTITTCFVTIFAVLKATLELLISISQSISFESNTKFSFIECTFTYYRILIPWITWIKQIYFYLLFLIYNLCSTSKLQCYHCIPQR